MGGETLQVVDDTYPRGSAGVEAGEPPVFKRNSVIEADKLHEHVADKEDEVFDVTGFVFGGHDFRSRLWGPGAFWRRALAGGGVAGGGVVKGDGGEVRGGRDGGCSALSAHLSREFGFGGERRDSRGWGDGPFFPFAAGFGVVGAGG